jgi:hypothetical protein
MIDRDDILARHQARKLAREKLIDDAKQTREHMRPVNIATRWKARQAEKLEEGAARTLQMAKKNKTFLGSFAVGAIMVVAHRPLLKVAKKLNEKFRNS